MGKWTSKTIKLVYSRPLEEFIFFFLGTRNKFNKEITLYIYLPMLNSLLWNNVLKALFYKLFWQDNNFYDVLLHYWHHWRTFFWVQGYTTWYFTNRLHSKYSKTFFFFYLWRLSLWLTKRFAICKVFKIVSTFKSESESY